MANISQLSMTFVDGSTVINADKMNGIVSKINEMVTAINNGSTPVQQTVAKPVINISGNTATITCSTSGATIYYTLNGNTPTTNSTQYSSPITLSGACTIKAIAVKSGMNNSSVASQPYTPSVEPDADATAIMARYSKTLSSAQQSAFNLFIVNLKNAGIYSKIKYLVLPILASDKTEATQNALSGASAFTDLGVDGITFANNGIKATEGQPVSAFNVVDSGTTYLQSNDFHVSAFNNNVIDSDKYTEEADILLGGVPVTIGKSYYKGQVAGISYQKTGDVSGSKATSESSSVCRASNHFVGSFSSSKEIFSINGTAVYNEDTMVVKNMNALRSPRFGCSVNNTTNYETNSSSLSGTAGTSKCNYGFISWGYALTESQCTSFNTYVQALMSAFIA